MGPLNGSSVLEFLLILCCFVKTIDGQPCNAYTGSMNEITHSSGKINTAGQFEDKDVCHWYFRRDSYDNVALKITFNYLHLYFKVECDWNLGAFMVLPNYKIYCGDSGTLLPEYCFVVVSQANQNNCNNTVKENRHCDKMRPSSFADADFGKHKFPNRSKPYVISYVEKAPPNKGENGYGFTLHYEWIDCIERNPNLTTPRDRAETPRATSEQMIATSIGTDPDITGSTSFSTSATSTANDYSYIIAAVVSVVTLFLIFFGVLLQKKRGKQTKRDKTFEEKQNELYDMDATGSDVAERNAAYLRDQDATNSTNITTEQRGHSYSYVSEKGQGEKLMTENILYDSR